MRAMATLLGGTACLAMIAALPIQSAQAQVLRGQNGRENASAHSGRDLVPDGAGRGRSDVPGPDRYIVPDSGGTGSNGIFYHGGPLILGTTHIYYIWYGNWSTDTAAQSILLNLASYIGGTRYYNINTTYYNKSGTHVSNAASYRGSAYDNYSRGTTLTDYEVMQVVSSAISGGKLPNDSNGVYFVLSSKDVKESSGFCTQYCGWHTHTGILGSNIKYAFVGNPAKQCPNACEEQTSRSPNGDPGADAMASTIAHELNEAVTDPSLNAWYDDAGQENSDKCAWTYGGTKLSSNGAKYDVTLGGRQYLIQKNWVNKSGGYCSMYY